MKSVADAAFAYQQATLPPDDIDDHSDDLVSLDTLVADVFNPSSGMVAPRLPVPPSLASSVGEQPQPQEEVDSSSHGNFVFSSL